MQKTYIYDLTVLINQQVSDTPTGTVRVDLRYAQYFLTTRKESTLFVKQQGKQLVIIRHDEVEALIDHLAASWESKLDADKQERSKLQTNVDFRMQYHGLWEPDLETFFSMPFRDRVDFLLSHELTEIFGMGMEFNWVKRLPHVLKIWYALVGSLAKYPALFLLKFGQFIGIYLQTRNIRDSFKFISTSKQASDFLINKVQAENNKHYYYVYTAYNRGFPFEALEEICKITAVEYCIFIHDLIIINYAEYFIPVNRQQQVARMKRLLTLKPRLIANSFETKRHIEKFASNHKRALGEITTVNIGVEPCFLDQRSSATAVNGKIYFVVISTIEPRKNHMLLLNIWRELAQCKLLEPLPELYIIGRRGWENENVIDMVERCLPLQGIVHENSNLSDTALISLLQGARAMLYPSFCEGWGMPIVEALTLGTPVICSDIPELKESGQNVADYIHPIDGKGWMEAIIDYCQMDSPMRLAQLQRIKAFKPPTWEAHFQQVSAELFTEINDAGLN